MFSDTVSALKRHSLKLGTWSVATKSWQNDWFARFNIMVSIMAIDRQEAHLIVRGIFRCVFLSGHIWGDLKGVAATIRRQTLVYCKSEA